MGGGSSKAHQSFAVAPASTATSGSAALAPPTVASKGALSETPPVLQGSAVLEVPAMLEELAPAPVSAEPAQPDRPPGPGSGTSDGEAGGPDPGLIGDDALIPVPASAPAGDPTGVPLLVGGADLEDSLATLVSYQGSAKSLGTVREVLHATVAPDAEAKLLEALALSEEHLVPVTVERQIDGRLPLDTTHQLYEQLEAAVKSVNHHLHAGDGIPAHTLAKHGQLQAMLEELKQAGTVTDAEKQMLEHYASGAALIAERLQPGFTVPYDEGGKVPKVSPHEVAQLVGVTEYVPAPASEAVEGLLPAQIRDATRIQPSLADGVGTWNGQARSKASGKEYVVDLGDGFTAVYRPYAGTGKATAADFSHRGALELVAPPGAGHGPQLVAKLGDLNLVNRPLTRAEGEWAYLTRNVWAQQLDARPSVAAALSEAQGLEDAIQELLIAERQHQVVGMGEKELHRFARQLRLDAEARALPHKVRILREGVAKAVGVASGDALAQSPGYDPTPRRSGGWLVWDRFDVAASCQHVDAGFGSKGLFHHVTAKNLVEVLESGVLASSERRRLMGVKPGKGMSESADMTTGGAKSVFLRVGARPSHGPMLFWADPSRLLRRSDWYAYASDHFGSLNPDSHHSTSAQMRSPKTIAGFNGGNNEVMLRHGIDMFGGEAPSHIICSSTTERSSVLALLKKRGIAKLAGRPIEEVVMA